MKTKLPDNQLKLIGNKVFLLPISLSDCTEKYLNWLTDPEVNRYLETRWVPQNMESIRCFVSRMIEDPSNYLFGIRELKSEQHIGNIKLGPINPEHAYADVSYFIGDKRAWGKGFATEAIKLITRFGFERLNLHRLQARLYSSNIGSARALEKAGYQLEAVFKKQLRLVSDWEDNLCYSIFKEQMTMKF
ncbi:TPA: GNAT family N-acetyltransferase [Legionella pneumophila]|uniref:GNAT family N-acetyltransferase n=3 Tax=Gammaproteobacteria TaxID=1236 RepID=E7BB58_LEGPN|nr:GNAT family N-acetyltransferase [Legionella pneumophila]AGN13670.1 acetyltransferase [Legionella pneumophila subsp. pneumophila str. Thunder Bay]MCK0183378.1 GNAT family N-acetyltransferase [Legionella pneumophila]MCK1871833.1 GNAT family N-acetyltransferase [Legionella pneumophila]MCK1880928.1 GNAT family N-acetyltransferase [Legionella pneumophila]MCK1890324.1 GNAT family N-acetyltransferase [Legionella pneumophila]